MNGQFEIVDDAAGCRAGEVEAPLAAGTGSSVLFGAVTWGFFIGVGVGAETGVGVFTVTRTEAVFAAPVVLVQVRLKVWVFMIRSVLTPVFGSL